MRLRGQNEQIPVLGKLRVTKKHIWPTAAVNKKTNLDKKIAMLCFFIFLLSLC